jgi:hypothetical protein
LKNNSHYKVLDGRQQHGGTVDNNTIDVINKFQARFRRIKEAVRAKTDIDLAKVLGIKHSSVASAKDRKSIPLKWVLEISEKYGISSDWLLHGEGPMCRGKTTLPGLKSAPAVPNLKLIKEIIVMVEEALEEQEIHLPPRKKAELIALLYEEFAEDEERQEIPKEKILRFARALVA